MAPNLPPSITVNRNLAATLKNYIKANGGKNVSESELNNILQKVAKFDSERDAGTREGGSIFSGGSKYLGGSGKDFVVNQGQQIQLSTEEFNEIFKGYIDPVKAKETEKPPVTPELSTPSLSEDLKPAIPDKIDTPNAAKKQQTEAMLDSVDGKIIERQVNGTKQKIAVATVDGQKVRRAVNEDGSLGENLVTISTAGKNKYITQSEMDKRIQNVFPEGLPEGITASFVSIGGTPTLVFKKDGKTLDQAQLKEYALKAQEEQVEKFDNQMAAEGQAEINDIDGFSTAQFNVINQKYGDKQGNIDADEYFNYEYETSGKDSGYAKEDFRAMSDMNFLTMDENGDGEITKQELSDFLKNANEDNNNIITTNELSTYADKVALEKMQPQIDEAISNGYEIQESNGDAVYIKDGKSFLMNMDGSVGDEIGESIPATHNDNPPQELNSSLQSDPIVNNLKKDNWKLIGDGYNAINHVQPQTDESGKTTYSLFFRGATLQADSKEQLKELMKARVKDVGAEKSALDEESMNKLITEKFGDNKTDGEFGKALVNIMQITEDVGKGIVTNNNIDLIRHDNNMRVPYSSGFLIEKKILVEKYGFTQAQAEYFCENNYAKLLYGDENK